MVLSGRDDNFRAPPQSEPDMGEREAALFVIIEFIALYFEVWGSRFVLLNQGGFKLTTIADK